MIFVLAVNFRREMVVRRFRKTVLFIENVKYSHRFHLNQICKWRIKTINNKKQEKRHLNSILRNDKITTYIKA